MVKEETKREFKLPWDNENGNTIYQYLQDAANVVLRRKSIAINAYIKKQEKSPRI